MDNHKKIASELEFIMSEINYLGDSLEVFSTSKDHDFIMSIGSILEQISINLENIKNLF